MILSAHQGLLHCHPVTAPPSGPALPTLLLVDDQPANMQSLQRILSPGYRVLMATGGASAIELCRCTPPDLVLLDVLMPEIDGYEVCRQLKADPTTSAIPVIFVTAHNVPAQEARGLEAGAVDVIAKPISSAVVKARVATHLALARSSTLLAAILEATAEGLLVTDLNGQVSTINERFIRMWQLPPALHNETDERRLLAYLQTQTQEPQGLGLAALPLRPVTERGDGAGAATIAIKDGRFFERYTTVLKTHGRPSGRLVSFRDVTERRHAEVALAELNAGLEVRINERTGELSRALQLAEAAVRVKSDFLSNMSHEIRTPMNGVLGMTHLALQADPSPGQRDYLHKIGQSGQHLMGIINDILDFSRIEAGTLELDLVDFTLEDVMISVANQYVDSALRKGLRLSFEIDPALAGALHGDALRLRQVLLNYVGNAIKFSDAGEITVRASGLRCGESGEGGLLLRFEVQDGGIGMSEAELLPLFQAFHQSDTSSTRKYGGNGLGLAICKRLAELMGGEVGVQSQVGQGSLFWFTAQLARREAAAAGEAHTALSLAELELIHNSTILVVDDNPINQEIASELLSVRGARVSVALDGQQALDLLRRRHFDCVLMDLQMPVMDGLQATRQIRATAALSATRVIAMTANAREEDRQKCLEAGMDDFIVKPLHPAQFYALVARWLAPQTQAAVSARAPVFGAAAPITLTSLAGDPDVIDLAILCAGLDGRVDKVRKFAFMFIDAMHKTLAEIDAALAREDLAALRALGHRAKSSTATVGALGLSGLCLALQDLEDGSNPAQARIIVVKMAPLMARIVHQIDGIFGRLSVDAS